MTGPFSCRVGGFRHPEVWKKVGRRVNVGGQADHQMSHTQCCSLASSNPGSSAVVCVRVLVVRQHGSAHKSAGPAGVGRKHNTGSPAMSLSPSVRPMVVCGPRETGSLVTRAAGIGDWV